jgi:hypothetical protein
VLDGGITGGSYDHGAMTGTVPAVIPRGAMRGCTRQWTAYEFPIDAPEGVAVSGGEVAKGHAVPAAFLRVQLMNRACEAEGWQPARHSIGFDKGAKELLRLRGEDAVQVYRAGHAQDSLL